MCDIHAEGKVSQPAVFYRIQRGLIAGGDIESRRLFGREIQRRRRDLKDRQTVEGSADCLYAGARSRLALEAQIEYLLRAVRGDRVRYIDIIIVERRAEARDV